MKISIITVCYNADAVIDGCLQSVAEQTYRDIEHIVIDGRSKDATVATVQSYPHVSALVSEPDQGLYDAMNKGLQRVTGDFVLFLNADDTFASATAVAGAVAAIERDPGGDVYYGALEVRSEDAAHTFQPPPPAEAPVLMICGCLPHQSTLARPSVFAKTNGFDLRYRHHADYDWFLKILADPTIDVRSFDAVLGSFRLGGVSSQLAKGQPEVYRIQNESPLYASPEWDRKRISVLQEAWLQERLTTAQLRTELRAANERAHAAELNGLIRDQSPNPANAPAVQIIDGVTHNFRELPRHAVRLRLGRPRSWIRRAAVRWLPDRAVRLLREARVHMRTP